MLNPREKIVVPSSEDVVEPQDGKGKTVYDLMGRLILRAEQLILDLDPRKSLSDRQRRLHGLLKLLTPHLHAGRQQRQVGRQIFRRTDVQVSDDVLNSQL